jgi:hypothetical protein
MGGSAERRFCERCTKHVHSLSDMTPEEAERLLASAAPGTLCVRVEHDADGTVYFRGKGAEVPSPARSLPFLRVAVSASLLVAGCNGADPATKAVRVSDFLAAAASAARSQFKRHAKADTAAPADTTRDAPGSQPTRAAPKTGKNGKDRRVTMGCVCIQTTPSALACERVPAPSIDIVVIPILDPRDTRRLHTVTQ